MSDSIEESTSASSCSAAATCWVASPSSSSAAASFAPLSGTTCSSTGGRSSSSSPATGVARTSSASGTATSPVTSSSETPVEVNAVTTRPVRTTWAATGSSIAALSMPSTWSTTGPVRRTPCSRASDRAEVASALVSWRRCRVNARSSSPSRASAAARSESASSSTESIWSLSRRTSRLTAQADTEGFFSFVTCAASALSPQPLAAALRSRVKSSGDPAYSRSARVTSSSGAACVLMGPR